MLGSWIGGLLGGILYGLIAYAQTLSYPFLVLLLTILFSAIIGGILSVKYFDYAIIVGSAIGGSYLFIRGISLFEGGYPNEVKLYEFY